MNASEKKAGRKALEPTPDQRATVAARAAAGMAHARIAEVIGVSLPTLRKHFRAELSGPDAGTPLLDATPAPPRATSRAGRRAYAPGLGDRERAALMIATGSSQETIALALGITVPTLVKHFAAEIATGRARKRAEVLVAMMAAAKKGNASAQVKLIEAFDRADLADMGERFGAAPEKPAAPAAPGKKAAAQIAAEAEATTGEWGHLLDEPPPATVQ